VCGQNRHRDESESEFTLCMACRMRGVENDHIIHGWEDEKESDGEE
jgi:hypothetical protein